VQYPFYLDTYSCIFYDFDRENTECGMKKNMYLCRAALGGLVFFCIAVLLFYHSPSLFAEQKSTKLSVVDGEISVGPVGDSEVIPLNGEWKFVANTLLSAVSQSEEWEPIEVPRDWNKRVTSIQGIETGTYALTIDGLTAGASYSIHLGEVGAVARVIANGEVIGRTGRLDHDEGGPDVSFARPIFSFEARPGTNEIVIQAANGDLAVGGLWQRVYFGRTSAVHRHRLIRTAVDMIFIGGILILGLYYLFVFLLWPLQYSSLLLALYSFLVAIKSLFSGQQILFTTLPAFPDIVGIRLAHIATVISAPVFLQFIRYMYPNTTGKIGIRLSCSAALLQTLIIVFTPINIFQHTAFWYHGVIALHVPYIFLIYHRAKRKGYMGVHIGVIGFIVLILAGANDILHDQRLIHTTYLWNVGFFFFLFAQSILQAHRFQTIHKESERVKGDLQKAVSARTVELTLERDKLSTIAKTDELTGLLNRRYGMELLHNELNRVRRYGGSVVIALLDIDHFKHVNDTHGHLVGDQVLVSIGLLLKEGIRTVDVSARWGGEEFLLFFPNTELPEGKMVMEKIRTSIENYMFEGRNKRFTVTFSYGLHVFEGEQEGVEEVLHHCDTALYYAKDTGRNRGIIYSEIPAKM